MCLSTSSCDGVRGLVACFTSADSVNSSSGFCMPSTSPMQFDVQPSLLRDMLAPSLILCSVCSCCPDNLALLCAVSHTLEGFASLLRVGLTDGLCLAACLCPASKKPNLIHRPIQCSACWVQCSACSVQPSACSVQHPGRHSDVWRLSGPRFRLRTSRSFPRLGCVCLS